MTLDSRWQKAERILAMRLDNLGDVIMTGPALRAIKETLPASRLIFMAGPGAQDAAHLLPEVDEVVTWQALWQDMGKLPFDPARELALIESLRSLGADAAIIFTSFSQSPHVAAYACYLAGVPLRLGEPKDFGGAVLSDQPPTPSPFETHQAERNLRLVESAGFHARDRALALRLPAPAQARARRLLAEQGLAAAAPYALLCPWTSCQARTYPRFAAVGHLLRRASGLPIVVTGAPRDREAAAALLAEIGPGAIDLVGRTSFAELAALVADACLVLTNNTATMHLADATRTPQVVLFAGTELPEQWAPRHGPTRLLSRPTLCRPCYQLTCPRDLACLDIVPDQVVATALCLLGEAEGAAIPEAKG